MLPLDLIDVIVIHELGHFIAPRQKNKIHHKEFYRSCEKIIADFRNKENKVSQYSYLLNF